MALSVINLELGATSCAKMILVMLVRYARYYMQLYDSKDGKCWSRSITH